MLEENFPQFFNSFFINLSVEIVLGILVFLVKKLIDYFTTKRFECRYSGYWKNYHFNLAEEEIVEIVKIKQVRSKIKATIWQYKNISAKKYYCQGIIYSNLILMYYARMDQAGIIALKQIIECNGSRRLEGEYLEDLDIEKKTQEKIPYILRPIKMSLLDRLTLALCKTKFEYAKKIIGLEDDK